MLPQNQGSFLLLQIKARSFLQFSSRSNQRPSTTNQNSNISNHKSNSETSKYNSRSSFIALWIIKFLGDWIRGVLLYSFIVKSHTEDCTHIYTNQYKLIICYTISWPCDSSFMKIVCIDGKLIDCKIDMSDNLTIQSWNLWDCKIRGNVESNPIHLVQYIKDEFIHQSVSINFKV